MRIDLPRCGFKACRYQADGNCTQPAKYQACEYILAIHSLNTIVGSQKLCTLCQNYTCEGVSIGEPCSPIWSGLRNETP